MCVYERVYDGGTPQTIYIQVRHSRPISVPQNDPEGSPLIDSSQHQIIQVSIHAHEVFYILFYSTIQPKSSHLAKYPGRNFGTLSPLLVFLSKSNIKQLGSLGVVQRIIVLHEPHDGTKFPIYITRRHGRRLKKTYG